ncbi:drug/metabolite transporter (DMT)-like permease [Flavobacterium cutihirudinis]|uniref:Drug/metabolite transporter (DMT)-like permease n=1 Tax=Flavobacterium cutihirudinis TaxID=1265740 RepID=A0A3D9FSP7_9FLAO|nr:EamA family transporter [Flavobacterium cutihirudinis]RED23667.1 drug/metabolite transporter (DMT)-like permease [Flavobacterium cutihirudinis]
MIKDKIFQTAIKFKDWKIIFAGIVFSFLWASASTATKIGLHSAQPFVISIFRFAIAGSVMLFISHVIMRKRLPQKKEWFQISIYGLLNITFYLGLYVIAMQKVSAGLGSLAVATNPVFIVLISAIWLSHKVRFKNIISLLLCFAGVFLAAYPLLQSSFATPSGILILIVSMIAYSLGTIYYSMQEWNKLDILTINGWQTILGGLFLMPLVLMTYQDNKNTFDSGFWFSTSWLAIAVSVGAIQVWLYLVKLNPIKASYWLFLCPIFGFLIAHFMVKEPLTLYTLFGVLLVIIGLYANLASKEKKN